MDKYMIKQELLKKEVKHIELSIEDYNNFLTASAVKRNEVTDLDDKSHQRQDADLSATLDKAVHNHEAHLAKIRAISFEPKTKVEPGAIVSVNGRCMIVAVSKPPFKIGDRNFIGISTDAPIYAELKGKKAGDSFMFNDQKFTIEIIN
jgi:transcription elongation GreA/GreB family factor